MIQGLYIDSMERCNKQEDEVASGLYSEANFALEIKDLKVIMWTK